jgi:hypothetical protein
VSGRERRLRGLFSAPFPPQPQCAPRCFSPFDYSFEPPPEGCSWSFSTSIFCLYLPLPRCSHRGPILAPRPPFPKRTSLSLPYRTWLAVYMGLSSGRPRPSRTFVTCANRLVAENISVANEAEETADNIIKASLPSPPASLSASPWPSLGRYPFLLLR